MTHQKQGQQSGTRSAVGQRSALNYARLAKTHEDYWKARIRKRTYKAGDGTTREVPEWQVKLFRDGVQRWINLETANRGEAARKARDAWLLLRANGWDAVKPKREKIANPTVGEFLDAVRAEADLSPATFEIYAKKFRRLVSGAFGIRGDAQKHNHRSGGHKRWLARVNAVRFSRITPAAVQRWKKRFLAAATANTIKETRAKRTLASVLRSSRALFAPKVLEKLKSVAVPTEHPLAGIDLPRVTTAHYVSKINPELLFQQAARELESPTDDFLRAEIGSRIKHTRSAPALAAAVERRLSTEKHQRQQMFRVLVFALFAGLRRDEVDTLTWAQIDFVNHVIHVQTNEYTRAKSEQSEAGIDIDGSFAELLRSWMEGSESKFVIEHDVAPRPEVSTYHHYRCATIFQRLMPWLRSKGITDLRALHTLRKEFGTQINRTHGLFAASVALRHSSIQLTRAVYVAKKDRAVFALPRAAASAKEAAL